MKKVTIPQYWNGYRVCLTKDAPVRQLALDVPVSEDVRKSVNAWMVEFFGTTNMVPDGQVLVMEEGKAMWMSARTWACLPPSPTVHEVMTC